MAGPTKEARGGLITAGDGGADEGGPGWVDHAVQVNGMTPSRPSISTRPGSRLLIWWAMTPADNRPVITRARPIGIATTRSNGVRDNSKWASANTMVVTARAHHRLAPNRSTAPHSSPR